MSTAPLRDRLIPWYFVMAFIVVFTVNGVFVYMATNTHTGVITEQAYEKGLAYDDVLTQTKQQAKLGWEGTLQLHGTTDDLQLTYQLVDAEQQPITGAHIEAYMTRPTQDGYDTHIAMDETTKEGIYQLNTTLPLTGLWDITIHTLWKQQQHQTHKRVVVE